MTPDDGNAAEDTRARPPSVPVGRLIWRRKRLVVAVTVAFLGLGLVLGSLGTRSYSAETLILLQSSATELSSSPLLADDPLADPNTAVALVSSRRILEHVIEAEGLLDNPEFNPARGLAQRGIGWRAVQTLLPQGETEVQTADTALRMAIAWLRDRMTFQAMTNSGLVRLQVSTQDPVLSASLANRITETFLNDLIATRIAKTARVAQQLGNQVAAQRRDLRDKKAKLQALANQPGFVDQLRIEENLAEAARLRDLMAQQRQRLADRRALAQQLDALRGQPEDQIAAAIAGSQTLQDLANTLGETASLDRLLDALRSQIARRDRALGEVEANMADLRDTVAQQSEQLLRYQQLEREVETSSDTLAFSVQRLNQLSVQSGLIGGSRVITPADPPLEADGSGRGRNVVLLGLLGMFLSFAWILLREVSTRTIHDTDDLFPVVPDTAIVPVPSAPRSRLFDRAAFERRMLISAVTTDYSEAIRRLRTVLTEDTETGRALVLQVTSDSVSDSKTEVAIALARSMALLARTVLIVEADMRTDNLSRHLKRKRPAKGLQEAIDGSLSLSDAVQRDDRLELDYLAARKVDRNPADLLDSDGFGALLRAARARYDLVVIDTPPSLLAADAVLVGRLADCVVLIARNDMATIQSVTASIAALGRPLSLRDAVVLYGGSVRRVGRVNGYTVRVT